MKVSPVTFSLIFSLVAPHFANAETDKTGFFLGGTAGTTSVKESSAQYDLNESGRVGGVLLGAHFTENFGLEGLVLVGVQDSFVTQSATVAPKATFSIRGVHEITSKFWRRDKFRWQGVKR